jgi:hypothetical protein
LYEGTVAMRGPKVKSEKAQRFISRGTRKAISKAHFPGLEPEFEDAFLALKKQKLFCHHSMRILLPNLRAQ